MGLFSEVAQAFENAAGRGSRAFDAVACRPEWPFMKQRATFPSKVQQQNPTASDFLVASNLSPQRQTTDGLPDVAAQYVVRISSISNRSRTV